MEGPLEQLAIDLKLKVKWSRLRMIWFHMYAILQFLHEQNENFWPGFFGKLWQTIYSVSLPQLSHSLNVRTVLLKITYCHTLGFVYLPQLYRPLNVRVALLMMITWSNGDKIKVEVDSDKTLSNFLDYRNKDIVNLLKSENIKSHDNAQLLSWVVVQFICFSTNITIWACSIYFTKINVARKPKRNQYSLYYLGSPE